MKIFLGLCIVFLCTFYGTVLGKKGKRKSEFYLAFEGFVQYVKREISFSNEPIITIVKNYKTVNEDLNILLCDFANCSKYSLSSPCYLKDSEVAIINSFLTKLGHSDRSNEVEMTSAFYNDLKSLRKAEDELCKKRLGLSTRIGFFVGAIIFILLM